MELSEVQQAMTEHNDQQEELDGIFWQMARFVSERLPVMALKSQPDAWHGAARTLRLLKRQLKQFDSTTDKWKR